MPRRSARDLPFTPASDAAQLRKLAGKLAYQSLGLRRDDGQRVAEVARQLVAAAAMLEDVSALSSVVVEETADAQKSA